MDGVNIPLCQPTPWDSNNSWVLYLLYEVLILLLLWSIMFQDSIFRKLVYAPSSTFFPLAFSLILYAIFLVNTHYFLSHSLILLPFIQTIEESATSNYEPIVYDTVDEYISIINSFDKVTIYLSYWTPRSQHDLIDYNHAIDTMKLNKCFRIITVVTRDIWWYILTIIYDLYDSFCACTVFTRVESWMITPYSLTLIV